MDKTLNEFTPIFLDEFEYIWNETLQKLKYNQNQLVIGNRLRPQICLWGYLSLYPNIEVTNISLSNIASVSVSIEMIHKASLLLDDWIDCDSERHGKPTFHKEYSPQETVLVALNLISFSMYRLKSIFQGSNKKLPIHYFICLETLLNTIYSMARGALDEIRLNNDTLYCTDVINNISSMETSKIISNSLLLGYYVGLNEKTPDPIIEKHFNQIGETCGYIFQVMNDLEAFSNPQKLLSHKGNLNYDVLNNRKNIAIAALYETANANDKRKLQSAPNENIYPLIEKYHIINLFKDQLNDLYISLFNDVSALVKENISIEWINGFQYFLNYIKTYGENRLKK